MKSGCSRSSPRVHDFSRDRAVCSAKKRSRFFFNGRVKVASAIADLVQIAAPRPLASARLRRAASARSCNMDSLFSAFSSPVVHSTTAKSKHPQEPRDGRFKIARVLPATLRVGDDCIEIFEPWIGGFVDGPAWIGNPRRIGQPVMALGNAIVADGAIQSAAQESQGVADVDHPPLGEQRAEATQKAGKVRTQAPASPRRAGTLP
jgi:hypothetical protein